MSEAQTTAVKAKVVRTFVGRVVSDNLAYRTDVDTPEDVAALAERTGHRLLWPVGQAAASASDAP